MEMSNGRVLLNVDLMTGTDQEVANVGSGGTLKTVDITGHLGLGHLRDMKEAKKGDERSFFTRYINTYTQEGYVRTVQHMWRKHIQNC